MSEAQLHRAVAAFLAVALPAEGCTWTTFPAGGGGKTRGGILKGAGLRPGWPDIQILWRNPRALSNWGVLICIELKTQNGVLSREQIRCHRAIHEAGGVAYMCRSIEAVESALRMSGIPLRATTQPGGGWRRA